MTKPTSQIKEPTFINFNINDFVYVQLTNEFQYDGFVFEDFFDGGGTERYTFHYLWCLYAINWGISQYDSHVKEAS
jgi:hypothetical protein